MRKRGLSGKVNRAMHARNSGNEQIAKNTLQELISIVPLRNVKSHFWGITSHAIPTKRTNNKNRDYFAIISVFFSVKNYYYTFITCVDFKIVILFNLINLCRLFLHLSIYLSLFLDKVHTWQGNISEGEEHTKPHIWARSMNIAMYLGQVRHKRCVRTRYAAIF